MYIKKYFKEIKEHGADSEIALYTPISTYIIKGILGYPSNKFSLPRSPFYCDPLPVPAG